MAPTWEDLAADFTKNSEVTHIAEVDCTLKENAKLAQVYNIRAYPTLILYELPLKFVVNQRFRIRNDGKMYEYRGSRTIEAFSEFAKSSYINSPALDRPE
jgi:hypothetical protein